ncbi:MAG: hypothetical protein ACYSTL_00475 [Planctomycetota bacterium]|jgi:hypothetical protein
MTQFATNRTAWVVLVMCASLSGCAAPDRPEPPAPPVSPPLVPLAFQQLRTYRETVTGRFISLVDFEDTAPHRGFEQVDWFSIRPHAGAGERKFAVNITRTGAAAMSVALPKGSRLVLSVPYFQDFSGYSLVSFALHSETLRGDLCVTVGTGQASWTSHRTLVAEGWNTVLVDIKRLESLDEFDIENVRTIEFFFADAVGPVRFYLDDILLIDNARELEPVPPGFTVRKE